MESGAEKKYSGYGYHGGAGKSSTTFRFQKAFLQRVQRQVYYIAAYGFSGQFCFSLYRRFFAGRYANRYRGRFSSFPCCLSSGALTRSAACFLCFHNKLALFMQKKALRSFASLRQNGGGRSPAKLCKIALRIPQPKGPRVIHAIYAYIIRRAV